MNQPRVNRVYWLVSFAFVASGLASSLVLQHHFWDALRGGLSITDVASLALSLEEVQTVSTLFLIKRFDLLSLMVLYAPGFRVSAWLYPVINALLLLLSAGIYKSLVVNRQWPGQSMAVALIGIAANPFLLLTMPGPNKEIPLLAITLALCWVLLRRPKWWLVAALALACLAATFRDGYGAILLVFVGARVLSLWLKLPEWQLLLLIGVFCLLAIPAAQLAAEWLPFLRRNAEAALRIQGQARTGPSIGGWLAGIPMSWVTWLKRAVLNAVSLGLFPVVAQTTGRIYWIGVGYWIFGVVNLLSAVVAVWALFPRRADPPHPDVRFLAAFWLGMWLLLSVSLYVQPRYMMVLAPMGLGLLSAIGVRARTIIVVGTLAAIALTVGAYTFRAGGLSKVETDMFWVNPYVR